MLKGCLTYITTRECSGASPGWVTEEVPGLCPCSPAMGTTLLPARTPALCAHLAPLGLGTPRFLTACLVARPVPLAWIDSLDAETLSAPREVKPKQTQAGVNR